MYYWYKFFTYLFYPFASVYLYFRKLKKKEDPIRYKEKLSKISIPRGSGFLIWFHVASVGEAMSILALIENCIEEKKIDKILLTSITLSSGKNFRKKIQSERKSNSSIFTFRYLYFNKQIFGTFFLQTFFTGNKNVQSHLFPA